MSYDSVAFIYFFLPPAALVLLIAKDKHRTVALLALSTLFYLWGAGLHFLIILSSVCLNYAGISAMNRTQRAVSRRRVLLFLLAVNIAILAVFKYANFIIENVNILLTVMNQPVIDNVKISLPLGISFIVFHNISFIVDIYRKHEIYDRGILHAATYVLFFPKIIAGPITRYSEYANRFIPEGMNIESFWSGMQRFSIGLGKKAIIANTLGTSADLVFANPAGSLTFLISWCGILAYTLQLYFDFSGYSDMAIGIGRMIGFNVPENFNYPYIASSIRDFWRRWHMTMTDFFKHYLYIPLGGNRSGKIRNYINLGIVFMVTGLWHGANWTFIVWGIYHGIFMIVERLGFDKVLNRAWSPFRHAYALLLVMIGWVFFRSDSLCYAFAYLRNMAGLGYVPEKMFPIATILNRELIIILLAAAAGSTPVFPRAWARLRSGINGRYATLAVDILAFIFTLTLMVLSAIYITGGSNHPFLYQKF